MKTQTENSEQCLAHMAATSLILIYSKRLYLLIEQFIAFTSICTTNDLDSTCENLCYAFCFNVCFIF